MKATEEIQVSVVNQFPIGCDWEPEDTLWLSLVNHELAIPSFIVYFIVNLTIILWLLLKRTWNCPSPGLCFVISCFKLKRTFLHFLSLSFSCLFGVLTCVSLDKPSLCFCSWSVLQSCTYCSFLIRIPALPFCFFSPLFLSFKFLYLSLVFWLCPNLLPLFALPVSVRWIPALLYQSSLFVCSFCLRLAFGSFSLNGAETSV